MPEPVPSPAAEGSFEDFMKTMTVAETPEKVTEKPAEGEISEEKPKTGDSEKEPETEETTEAPIKVETQEKQSRFNKRIGQLTRRIREQEAELQALREAQERAGAQPAVADKGDPKPLLKDCENYEDFVEKLSLWNARKLIKEQQALTAGDRDRQTAAAQQQAAMAAHHTRVHQFVSKNGIDDWDDVVTESDVELQPGVLGAILESPHSAELAYFLGKNPEVADQFSPDSGMTPATALREIWRLEDRLFPDGSSKKSKKVTTAPKPPAQAGGRTQAREKNASDFSDYNEWEKYQRAKKA